MAEQTAPTCFDAERFIALVTALQEFGHVFAAVHTSDIHMTNTGFAQLVASTGAEVHIRRRSAYTDEWPWEPWCVVGAIKCFALFRTEDLSWIGYEVPGYIPRPQKMEPVRISGGQSRPIDPVTP